VDRRPATTLLLLLLLLPIGGVSCHCASLSVVDVVALIAR